jgi:hypothetical protein
MIQDLCVCHLVLTMRSKVSLELWASLNAFSVTTEKGERCSRVQCSAVNNRVKIRLAVMFDILKRLQRVSATLDAVCVCVCVWRVLSHSIPAIVSYYNAYITEIIGGNEGKARYERLTDLSGRRSS